MNIPKIILSRPKLILDIKCPKCRSYDVKAIPEIDVECKNCKTKFTAEPNINIYSSIAKKLIQSISNNNETYIIGERDSSTVFHANDMMKPRSKSEDDIWHTLLAIEKHFRNQKCYELSEITNEYDTELNIRCNDCGTCYDCVRCSKCNKHYTPKTVKKDEKRFTCPNCGSKSYSAPVIKKFKDKHVCPHCGSHNTRKTKFSSGKKQCPRCSSTNITVPRKVPVYRLIIKRQRRNWKDE